MKIDADLNRVMRYGHSVMPEKRPSFRINFDLVMVVFLSLALVAVMAFAVRGACVGIVNIHQAYQGGK